jgi:hypothetical protein
MQGKDWYYDLTVEPLRDVNNEVSGVTCAAVDITDRKQTEIARQKSETLLNAILASSPLRSLFWIATSATFMPMRRLLPLMVCG